MKSVVAPLIDLKGPGAEGGAVRGVKVGQKGFNIIGKVFGSGKVSPARFLAGTKPACSANPKKGN